MPATQSDFSEFIFNRTADDVESALSIREEKVKTFSELSEEDLIILERGFLTINTLNRIERAQIELRTIFNGAGYFQTQIENKAWDYSMIFNDTEFQRIITNTKILRRALFVYDDTPETPSPKYHYNNINSLEKILFDLTAMIAEITNLYRECGAAECGG